MARDEKATRKKSVRKPTAAKAPKKTGRPSKCTAQVTHRICQEIANGASLRKICEAPDMPHAETVRRWLNDDDVFRVQYARARDEQADYYADEIIGISDEEDDPQKARVRIDARKWVASKLKPKKYGDSLNLGGDLNLTMSDDQLESRLLKLLGKAGAVGAAGREGAAGE